MCTCVIKKGHGYGECSVRFIHIYDRTRKKKEKKTSELLNEGEEEDEKKALYLQSPLND
jgi:hypothetical protein